MTNTTGTRIRSMHVPVEDSNRNGNKERTVVATYQYIEAFG